MTTYRCSIDPDPKRRKEPVAESSVHMEGNWTYHAYRRSHDGKNNIIFRADGFDVTRSGATIHYNYTFHLSERGFYWHPNNDKIVYFGTGEDAASGGRCVVLLELARCSSDQDGQKPPHTVLYAPPPGHIPFGMEWSPSGKALYVVEKYREESVLFSRIVRVDLDKTVTQVARINGLIDFFMPPVSRFENGEGPSSQNYYIVFGHPTGLYLTGPAMKGGHERVSQVPAVGLRNIEWHPRKNQLALYFERATIGPNGKRFQGVYLVHLDRIGRQQERGEYLEHVYKQTDIHTLWYSPRGTYVTWSSPDAIYYRKPEDPPEKTVKIVAVHDDLELEIKGVSWHAGERMLAFTAGNHVFVHEVSAPDQPPRLVATFGQDTTHFTAEPIWLGDEVYLTVFQDLTRRAKPERSTVPVFQRPEDALKESQDKKKDAKDPKKGAGARR